MPADPAPPRVLVVEDTDATRAMICEALTREAFAVDQAVDAFEARVRLATSRPDVIVLDIELPDVRGFDLLRELLATVTVPVVVLTGRGAEVDRVVGLELGADDYIVKPFFPRELVARVRRAAGRPRPPAGARLDHGRIVIDTAIREVTVDGRPVELTAKEFDLLAHLAAAPRRTFSRGQLLVEVWRSSPEWQSAKTVTEHVRRLRNKIEADPARPRWIRTVGRMGYRFEPT